MNRWADLFDPPRCEMLAPPASGACRQNVGFHVTGKPDGTLDLRLGQAIEFLSAREGQDNADKSAVGQKTT